MQVSLETKPLDRRDTERRGWPEGRRGGLHERWVSRKETGNFEKIIILITKNQIKIIITIIITILSAGEPNKVEMG